MAKRRTALPELLSPAGTMECFYAAVEAGADAVYVGGELFSARAFAGNFSREELSRAVVYAHAYGVKLYVAVNTLLFDGELPEALDYVGYLDEIGVDAVIVADMGLAAAIALQYPRLPMHASTQASVHDSTAASAAAALGFSRVVPARELSRENIAALVEGTPTEIEVFLHGALCVCHSGQCLFSSLVGGRSGNRGACAQPCRLPYQAGGKEGYFMNLKDLCGAYHLQELIEAGVASLKIEGRLKGEAYVAGITGYYKGLMNEYADTGRLHSIQEEELDKLKQLFNRGGFTDGYYVDKQHMIEGSSPKHQGIPVAKVVDVRKGRVTIRSSKPLHSGDELEFRIGKPPYPTLRLAASMLQGETKASFFLKDKVQPGDEVWRVVDPVLQQQIIEGASRLPEVPIAMAFSAMIGQPAQISAVVLGESLEQAPKAQTIYGPVVEMATARGLTEEAVTKQLSKTGDTGYRIDQLEIQLQEGSFLPVSVLNQMRRDLLEKLSKVDEYEAKELSAINMERETSGVQDIWIGLDTPEQWNVIVKMDDAKVTVLFPSMEGFERTDKTDFLRRAAGKKIVPSLPMVGRLSHRDWMENEIRAWMEVGVKDFEANLMGQTALIEKLGGKVWAGPGLAVMNQAAAAFWQERAESVMLSWELTGREMAEIGRPKTAYWMAYGRIPYMVSEQCVYKEARGCGKRTEGRKLVLKDRKGEQMVVRSHCSLCYSEILSEKPIYLLGKKGPTAHARVQLTLESEDEVCELWNAYLEGRMPAFPTQVGHWDKGVD